MTHFQGQKLGPSSPFLTKFAFPRVKRLNKEPTRHSTNAKSSLLDLVLATDPQNIINTANMKTGIADHDGVVCQLKSLNSLSQETIAKSTQ